MGLTRPTGHNTVTVKVNISEARLTTEFIKHTLAARKLNSWIYTVSEIWKHASTLQRQIYMMYNLVLSTSGDRYCDRCGKRSECRRRQNRKIFCLLNYDSYSRNSNSRSSSFDHTELTKVFPGECDNTADNGKYFVSGCPSLSQSIGRLLSSSYITPQFTVGISTLSQCSFS